MQFGFLPIPPMKGLDARILRRSERSLFLRYHRHNRWTFTRAPVAAEFASPEKSRADDTSFGNILSQLRP